VPRLLLMSLLNGQDSDPPLFCSFSFVILNQFHPILFDLVLFDQNGFYVIISTGLKRLGKSVQILLEFRPFQGPTSRRILTVSFPGSPFQDTIKGPRSSQIPYFHYSIQENRPSYTRSGCLSGDGNRRNSGSGSLMNAHNLDDVPVF
jgi:hypothetical protein